MKIALLLIALLMLAFPAGMGNPSNSTPAAPTHAPVAPALAHPSVTRSTATMLTNVVCAGVGSSSGFCVPPVPATNKPAETWDASENETIVFGGISTGGVATQATTEWNGTGWTALTTGTTPPVRANATMVYDVNDGYDLLFGGYLTTGAHYRSDTYTFKNDVWTALSPGTSPSARSGYSMAYVPTVSGHGGYALLFGGNPANGKFVHDTWEFSAGTWTNITATAGTAPASRTDAGVAYDSVDNYVVLWGGLTGAGVVNDTWEFNPVTSTWTQLFASGSTNHAAGPKADMDPQMGMDTADGAVILNGGATGTFATGTSEVVIGWKQTWAFVGGAWSNITTSIQHNSALAGTQNPLPTYGAGFSMATLFSYILMAGGKSSSGITNATVEFGTLLGVTISPNVGELVKGTSLTLYANVTFGAPPFTYVWSSLPSGCLSANVSVLTCSPTSTGLTTPTVTVTDVVGASNAATSGPIWIDATGSGNDTLTVASGAPVRLPPTFWALDYRCAPENNATCVAFVNASPVRWFRVAGSMEGYNATSGVEYARFGGISSVNWNWTAIKSLCAQVHPCNTVTAVPTQNNDTALTDAVIRYVETNFSYKPTYWSLGNEPQGWVHFNQGFSATPYSQPYPFLTQGTAYKLGIVDNRIATSMLTVDSGIHFNLIQSASCGNNLFNTEPAIYAHADGTSPVESCHAYPGGGPTLGDTVAWLLSQNNLTRITTALLAQRTGMAAACGGCALPIWVTEFAAALNTGTAAGYLRTWPGAVAVGANLAQFISINLSQFEYFYMGCGSSQFSLLGVNCAPTPVSQFYTNVVDHFRVNSTWNVTASGAVGKVFGTYGKNSTGTGSSLFLVNANSSVNVTVTTPARAIGKGGATIFYGTEAGGWSNVTYGPGLVPATLTLAPLEMVLVNSLVGVPNAPTNLSFVGTPSRGNVNLTWTNPSGPLSGEAVYGFTGLAGVGCGSTPSIVLTVGAPPTSAAGAQVTLPDTYYSFDVTAANSTGYSAASNCIRFKTAPTVPPVVASINAVPASTHGNTSLFVSWTRIASSVNVTKDTVAIFVSTCGGALLHTYTTAVAALNYTITNLSVGTAYEIAVLEWNATGQGHFGACALGTTAGGIVVVIPPNDLILVVLVVGIIIVSFILLVVAVNRRED